MKILRLEIVDLNMHTGRYEYADVEADVKIMDILEALTHALKSESELFELKLNLTEEHKKLFKKLLEDI